MRKKKGERNRKMERERDRDREREKERQRGKQINSERERELMHCFSQSHYSQFSLYGARTKLTDNIYTYRFRGSNLRYVYRLMTTLALSIRG